MRASLSLFALCIFFLTSVSQSVPRIAIAGIAIETSTFSPARTDEEAFHAKYAEDAFSSYPFLSIDSALRKQAIWIPAIVARSLPGGMVTRKAYESLVNKTLDSLKAHLPYDGIYLDLHGAMSVEGIDDPEGDYLVRIRKAVGYKTLISASMDLHGNVSYRLAKNLDLVTCYRKAPHEDAMETKKRAVTELINRLVSGKGKPLYKAYVEVPVLLPGEKTSTRLQPAKGLYEAATLAARQKDIIDASIWIGYAWADEPRDHAVVMAMSDKKQVAISTAGKLAKHFWDVRNEFAFVAPTGTLDESINAALKSKVHPYFISDLGDNPTAGAAGDVTWTLTRLISNPAFKQAGGPSLIYASIPGPDLVEKAIAAGIGAHVEAYAGAKIDDRYAGPVLISGTVKCIVKGDVQAEVEVVIQQGSLFIIVNRKRKAYRTEADYTALGLQPRLADIVMVKLGYLDPELYDMQKGWMMALTPGGADQDIEHLQFRRIKRPMFPFDKDMKAPNLTPVLIPVSGK